MSAPKVVSGHHMSESAQARLRRRYRSERRFRALGLTAVLLGLAALALLLVTIVSQGYTAFVQTRIALDVPLSAEVIDPEGTLQESTLRRADYQSLANEALYAAFPEVTSSTERRGLRRMISAGAGMAIRDLVMADPTLIDQTVRLSVLAHGDIDQLHKGNIARDTERSRLSADQIAWYDQLVSEGRMSAPFNWALFTAGDSREPELAGLRGAIIGSLYLMAITLVLSFPIAVGAAIYLEEFAPKNRATDLIEVNINNLAAIPSIIFGLLGLAVFIQAFGLPRSSPLVGGMVLSLMTLPTIIIAARASLKSVPPSIREAALGMGASRLQTVFHHVLPLALPGILTGTIIGLAQALGETAPLLLIGMNAFVPEAASSVTSPSTAMPIQIYMWAGSSQRGFVERTSAAIMVLLVFLMLMNALAIWLRRRFERRW